MPADNWYAIYRKVDGELMSVGSVVNEIPSEFDSVLIPENFILLPETSGVDFSQTKWNAQTKEFEPMEA